MTPLRILILGSSYGILPATKLSLAGHKVTLVGRSEEISTIERTGIELHVPSRETESPLIVRLSARQGECVDASQPGLVTRPVLTRASMTSLSLPCRSLNSRLLKSRP